jgi:hypothetical protein
MLTTATYTYDNTLDKKRNNLIKKLNPNGMEIDFRIGDKPNSKILEDLETQIIAFSRPLKFHDGYKRHTVNVGTFLSQFFELNSLYYTMYADDISIACPPNKFRSLIDIYLITRYYFPGVALRTVLKHLYKKQGTVVNSQICQMIKRRVYDGRKERHFRNEEIRDELGFNHQNYVELVED